MTRTELRRFIHACYRDGSPGSLVLAERAVERQMRRDVEGRCEVLGEPRPRTLLPPTLRQIADRDRRAVDAIV